MSLPRLLLRAARPTVRPTRSLVQRCSARPSLPPPTSTLTSFPPSRSYAAQKLDVHRLRTDVDTRARNGFYTLMKMQGPLSIQPSTANAIFRDFVTNGGRKEPAVAVKSMAKKYNLSIEDMTSLALVTYRIPDLSSEEKRAVLPQSAHKPVACQILQGCAQNADPLAVVHLMTAVYLSSIPTEPAAYELASYFPRADIPAYRETLNSLAGKDNADALTLQGLFAQREAKDKLAFNLFNQAMQHYKLGTRHPMQFPLMAPWNAIGLLGLQSPVPEIRAAAQPAFRTGADMHDDPLSCAHLASYYDRATREWLKYTSKAAASGHRDSSGNLAAFYRDAAEPGSELLADSSVRKALQWLLNWKKDSPEQLAEEWANVAADLGHKPSMLLLADMYEKRGEWDALKTVLNRAMAGGSRGEEWPKLVITARTRLGKLRPRL